ncbi:hypothetical protein THOD03_70220 [Vibrio harveyi]|nr:hypothetical protein THOD03_70220 [Vibrio harveyi]
MNSLYFTDWIKTDKSLKKIIDRFFGSKINSLIYQSLKEQDEK